MPFKFKFSIEHTNQFWSLLVIYLQHISEKKIEKKQLDTNKISKGETYKSLSKIRVW